MRKILIVDDEEFTLGMVDRMVQSLNYTTFSVTSGDDAFEIAQTTALDAIVTDFFIPDFGGLDLVKAFIDLPSKPKVIVMSSGSFRAQIGPSATSSAENSALSQALAVGAHAVLNKPVKKTQLSNILQKLVPLQPARGAS